MPLDPEIPSADLTRALQLLARGAAEALSAAHVVIASSCHDLLVWDAEPSEAELLAGAALAGPKLEADCVELADEPCPGVARIARAALAGTGGRLCAFFADARELGADERLLLLDLAGLAAARLRGASADGLEAPRAVRELARFGYWRLERASGRIVWSEEALRLFGYDPHRDAPTFAMALAAFPPKAQTELRRGVVRTWETGEEVSITSSLTRIDAARRDVLLRFKAEAPPAGEPAAHISGILLDVTEARSFDERLQREKDLLQATLDHMDQGLIVVEPDLSIPVLSKRVTELLCLPEEFARTHPSFVEVLNYQYESGAITLDTVTSSINSFILNREELPETHVYERETFDGKWLEVRTSKLPGGGFVRTFTDATARKRREAEVARAEAEYRTLFENAAIGLYRVSIDGRQIRANPALARLNGYASEAELVAAVNATGRRWYVQPGRVEEYQRTMRSTGRVTDFVSEVYRHRSRERMWVSETAWAIRDAKGEVVAYEGTVVDATERRRAEECISHMARHDGVTGLPNRLLFNERLEAALAQPGGGRLAVLCLDLDRFKVVNDTMGHPAGDALLGALAARFTGLLADGQTIARFGGDEFAVLMPGAGEAEARTTAQALIEAVREPVTVEGRPITVGASIGIARAPRDGAEPTQLLKCADLALYRAKAEGREGFRFFAPAMDIARQARHRLELDLRGALERSEFGMLYQPVVRLADGAVVGYEALLRWSHPVHGEIPPDTFIAIAEETSLIVAIGDWALSRACADAARLPNGVDVAVNVSTVQLARPDFETRLVAALAASGLAPRRLVLEITETALIDTRLDIAPMLGRLRARGIRAALDDFGTGYSSLGYLRRFAFDVLKIDRSFACHLAERETAAIVEALLDLGRRLDIPTIAEGVETEAQLEALRAAGCAYVQGHLLGAPRPLRDLGAR
jgi:diguanylate cyclase (GGDEF)-like protein/PAS domain S-box-containing protein